MVSKRLSRESGHRRKFLAIIDDTPECERAVAYASRRAKTTGGVLVLLFVIEPGDFPGLGPQVPDVSGGLPSTLPIPLTPGFSLGGWGEVVDHPEGAEGVELLAQALTELDLEVGDGIRRRGGKKVGPGGGLIV